jgi:hypothetical protein
MNNVERGKLILKEVPAGEVEKKVVMLLSKFAKSASVEQLTEKVRNTPYALSNDIEAEKAVLILEAFQKFGATAVFIPHITEKPEADAFSPVKMETEPEPEPSFTFETQPDLEEEPPPVLPVAKKNGKRRLTVILVTILLLLSLGYLSWQLWPVLGDKVLEWWDYFKQLL